MSLDDFARDRQSQSRTDIRRLRGEKRFKNALARGGVHAATGITESQAHVVALPQSDRSVRGGIDVGSLDSDPHGPAPIAHGL